MALMRRMTGSNGSALGPYVWTPSPQDDKKLPTLCEFLSSSSWPDGSARRPGTCLLFVDEGKLKACLSDRDQGLVAFVVGTSFADVLLACEGVLTREDADWRAQRPPPARAKR